MTMQGYIILRDIPKELVQLDMMQFNIQGGFRGFSHVEPGYHFVSIKDGDEIHEGFWCFVEADDAVIKKLDFETNSFQNCSSEDEQHYKELVVSGAMAGALIPVMPWNYKAVARWNILSNYLKKERFPFKLNYEEPMMLPEGLSAEETSHWYQNTFKSRFEQAFENTHSCEIDSFLTEFQYSFLKFIVRRKDEKALHRWLDLLQACYNAGERTIDNHPKLFAELAANLTFQFDFLNNAEFTPNSKLLSGISNMIEDMRDTGNANLVKSAQQLVEYFEDREIIL